MWNYIEPISKFWMMLISLELLFPIGRERKHLGMLTTVYAVISMGIVYRVTTIESIRGISFFLYLFMLVSLSALWCCILDRYYLKTALVYIFFYMNCVVISRNLADETVKLFLPETLQMPVSVMVSLLILLLSTLFFLRFSSGSSVYMSDSQRVLGVISAWTVFLSLEMWRRERLLQMDDRMYVIVFHYVLNLLICFLIFQISKEYQGHLRQKIVNQKNDIVLEEIEKNEDMVKQCYLIRHEFKHLCFQMQVMLQEKEYERLESFLEKYVGEKLSYNEAIQSGNHLVDMILTNRIREARRYDIAVTTSLSLTGELPLSENELSAVLLNLLDNAIEASRREAEGNRDIRIEMMARNGVMQITVLNRVDGDVLSWNPSLNTTKADAEAHGLGLKLIRQIADQHRGTFELEMKGSYFSAVLYL